VALTTVTVEGSYYELTFAVWERIYKEFLACIKSCDGPRESCAQDCKDVLGFPDGSLRPGVTLAMVDQCFTVCEEQHLKCLAGCNAKYRQDVIANAIHVTPGAPPPDLPDEVLAFKTQAGKKALKELGLKMAVGGSLTTFAGSAMRSVFRSNPYLASVGFALAFVGAINTLTGLAMRKIAEDPPDPSYRKMWSPRPSVLTALSDTMNDFDPAVAALLLEPIRNEVSVSIYAEAVAVSLERAAAATAAGYPEIAQSHMVASHDYAAVCSTALSRAKNLRGEAVSQLPKSVRTATVSRADLVAARRQVKESGFPKRANSFITKLTKNSLVTKTVFVEQLTSQPIPRDLRRVSVSKSLRQADRGTAERRTAAVFSEFAASTTR
jgi:hypothetical protein